MKQDDVLKLIENATIGLKDDAELRLDAKQELLSHIDAATEEHRQSGKSEQESLELALKDFGSPTEIAADLLSANRRRMKLRALIRISIRAAVVPIAIAIAAWVFVSSTHTQYKAYRIIRGLTGYDADAMGSAHMGRGRGDLSDDAMLVVCGDTSKNTKADQQRAIWERWPTNRIYYGNYITMLISGPESKRPDLATLTQEIRRGEQLDPDNSRYNYLLASLMFDQAAELEADDSKTYHLIVHDRQLLDNAMQEVIKGNGKPYLNTYSGNMLAERTSILGPPTTLLMQIDGLASAAGTLLPDLGRQRDIARVTQAYSSLLYYEGRKEEALIILDTWADLAPKLFESSYSLIEVLVAFAVVQCGENAAVLLDEFGEPDKAVLARERARVLHKPFADFKETRKEHSEAVAAILRRRAGFLDRLILPPVADSLTDEDLAPGRAMEQNMMERGCLIIFISLVMLLMLAAFLATLRWRFAKGSESAPLLLLPSPVELARTIGIAVVLPMLLFFVYTRYCGLSGRDYSFAYMWPRFLVEFLLLSATIGFLTIWMSSCFIYRRCVELAVPVPSRPGWFKTLLLVLTVLGPYVWVFSGKKDHALYKGSLTRSLLPILAAIVIIIGASTHPYLTQREASLVRSNVQRAKEFGPLMWPVAYEARVTLKLKTEALRAIASLDDAAR